MTKLSSIFKAQKSLYSQILFCVSAKFFDNTENPADPLEEQIAQASTSTVAIRSKAKAKPQPRELAGTTTIPSRERTWIDIEPSEQNLASYDLSKKVINLLRHDQTLYREEWSN